MHDAAEGERLNLQRYCICIIEFLSSQAIDPHLYFQQRMTGEIAQAGSIDDLVELLRRLIGWVDTLSSGAAQSERLDAILADQGFPPLAVIQTTKNENIAATLTDNSWGVVPDSGDSNGVR
jgi:hypothetical protein